MQWSVTVNSTYDGNAGVTQLINGTGFYYNTDGKFLLDGNTVIYDVSSTNLLGQAYSTNDPSTHLLVFLDTPKAPATPCVDMNAVFKDYLRFRQYLGDDRN